MKITRFLAVTAAAALCIAPASAQHGGDVLLTVENGSIRTASISEDGMTMIPNVRVFEAEFGELAPGFTDEPGFDSEPGTFPVPSNIGFRIRRALREWRSGTFGTISSESIAIGFGPLTPITTPATDTVVTGFSLAVGASGQWHRHLEYSLAPPHTDGIYLLELSLFSSSPAIAESRPFWLVFGNNAAEAEHEAAAAWVRRNLVCPADFNGDGTPGVQDIFDFLAAYFAGDTSADVNSIGGVTVQDVFDYLAAYFVGCAT